MKWFKHYTNAHKGGVIHTLIPLFGKSSAHGLYFLFVEYLSDKWDGSSEPEFKVLASELRSFLGLKQNKLSSFLVCLQNETSFSFKQTENFIEINFPKLLEIRHRDAFSAGIRPEIFPPKSGGEKNKSNKKRKSIKESWLQESFDSLAAAFKKNFPKSVLGPAEPRFFAQIKTKQDVADLSKSILHYRESLNASTWREPKTSFANYLGTKKSHFWRDYISPPTIENQSSICRVVPDAV